MSDETLEAHLRECEKLHGHLCPGQVLGVRMALLGCELIGISEPRGAERKKLIVWVEIDRCVTDAVSAVTGARLGRRSLKYVDYGKVAAAFLNVAEERAVRIVALESSRELADALYQDLPEKKERQMRAYKEAPAEDLFKVERVALSLSETDLPGRPRRRVICERCSEGVNDGREVETAGGQTLCRPCASAGYYRVLAG